ncbi:MAG: PGF-pre-PGF domain-containing protein [Candidatus Woesearchaeota archaeon]
MDKKNLVLNILIILFLLLVTTIRAYSTITINLNSPDDNSWHKTLPITFEYTPTIDSGTISSCELLIKEGEDWVSKQTDTEIEENTINTFNYDFNNQEGSYLWKIKCLDNENNNYYSSERTVNIDITAPTTSYSGKLPDDSSYTFNTWTSSSYVNVSLSCDDSGGSGCDKTYYCVDSSNSCSPTTEYYAVIQISDEGVWYVRFYSVDNVGNEENVKTAIIKIDRTPPLTTPTVVLANETPYSNNTWVNTAYVEFNLANCNDFGGSGCEATFYCIDTSNECNPNNVYSLPFNVSEEGISYVRYYSKDNVNNAEDIKFFVVKIDRTKPTTYDDVPTGWQNSPYNVTITPVDTFSGVNYTTYCLDGNCNNVSGSSKFKIEINTSGIHQIDYYSVDNAGNVQDIVTKYAYLDLDAPLISAWLGEPDIFYSPYSENSIITIFANITDTHSGINYVLTNFSGLSCGEQNMTYNATSGLYEISCNVQDEAKTKEFQPYNITIIAFDNTTNFNATYLTVILYNMSKFLIDNPCFRHGVLSTDFSKELDFNNINFIVDLELNLSCFNITNVWLKVAKLNFSNLNFSDPSIGSKLANLGNAISVTPKLPRQFGDSRIDINTTAFAELNTNTTITFYNLPFSSQPEIIADNSSKQASIQIVSWEPFLMPFLYDSDLIYVQAGNLTFKVEGFSGYNITDNLNPTINITSPVNGSLKRTAFVNITANGTGTEISKVEIIANGTTYYYNSSLQQITCTPISNGSDTFYCTIDLTSALQDGNHTLNVTVYDYGGSSGNSATESISFELDKTPPVITFSLSATTVYVGQTITATCTAIDSRDGSVSTNYSVNPSTSTPGTFTTTCTATDSAGNIATSTITYTVNNWPTGGGSGGGGTGIILPSSTMIWSIIEANSEKTFKISDKDIDVTEFSLSIKKTTSNIMIRIKKLNTRPNIVPELNNVYSYLEIEKTNLQEDNINSIKIKFKVSKKWLNDKGISKEDIVLNHYKNNRWNELPTTITGEDSEFVYYEAETNSLSYFAIAQTTKPKITTTPTPSPSPEPQPRPTPEPTPTQTPTAEKTPTPTQTPVEKKELSKEASILILVVLIIILLLLTYMIYRKRAFV